MRSGMPLRPGQTLSQTLRLFWRGLRHTQWNMVGKGLCNLLQAKIMRKMHDHLYLQRPSTTQAPSSPLPPRRSIRWAKAAVEAHDAAAGGAASSFRCAAGRVAGVNRGGGSGDHCSRDGTSRRGRTRCQTAAGRGPGCVSCRKIILDRSPNVCMRFVRLVKP